MPASDPLLTANEERLLFQRYHDEDDHAARDALVTRYLPLAQHLARRYDRLGEADDLAQVASIGLLQAIRRFDPCRATRFSSFAVPTILGELKRHFRDKGWAVRVPRELQERALEVTQVAGDLERELGRAPTAAQIADRTSMTVEVVLEARAAAYAHHSVSLDRSNGDDDENPTLGDALGVDDKGFDRADDAATIERLFACLSERERAVLRLRFQEDLTQAEIGARLGISQMHVSRLIRQALTRLQNAT